MLLSISISIYIHQILNHTKRFLLSLAFNGQEKAKSYLKNNNNSLHLTFRPCVKKTQANNHHQTDQPSIKLNPKLTQFQST